MSASDDAAATMTDVAPAAAAAAAPAPSTSEATATPAADTKGAMDTSDDHAAKSAGGDEAGGDEGAGGEEGGEEEKKTPAKPRAKRGSATPAATPASAGVSRAGRERKAVVAYQPPSPSRKFEELPFTVEAGPGDELGEIENIRRHMEGVNAQDDAMKALFHACYPDRKTGHTKLVIKKNIRSFSGYPNPKELVPLATERLERYDGATLRHVAEMLEVSAGGAKSKLIEHIVDFLRKPKPSGQEYKQQAARSGTKRKGDDDDSKPKRKTTSFMLFSNENRDRVKAKFPELATKEIASKLGELWRNLSDAEKEAWKQRAAGGGNEVRSALGSDDDDDEEESADDEQPKKKQKVASDAAPASVQLPAAWAEKISASLDKILSGADVNVITMSGVKKALAGEYGELGILAYADSIKLMVVSRLQQMAQQKEKTKIPTADATETAPTAETATGAQ